MFITGPATPGRRQLARMQHASSSMVVNDPRAISMTNARWLFSPDATTFSSCTRCISTKAMDFFPASLCLKGRSGRAPAFRDCDGRSPGVKEEEEEKRTLDE